jgi:hypothetical protein
MKTEAEKLFLKKKKEYIKQYGKKALYDYQLKEIIPFLDGVYYQDTAPIKPGYYIVNTDSHGGGGIHWFACYINKTKSRCYIYDSFSRTLKYIMPAFLDKLNKHNVKVYMSDVRDQEQYGQSQICGVLCCAWLYCVKTLGIRKAMTI